MSLTVRVAIVALVIILMPGAWGWAGEILTAIAEWLESIGVWQRILVGLSVVVMLTIQSLVHFYVVFLLTLAVSGYMNIKRSRRSSRQNEV